MSRRRHPKKEIEGALCEAENAGWRVVPGRRGHRWGVMLCPEPSRSGCQTSIWSTPRNASNHAAQLRRALARCDHRIEDEVHETEHTYEDDEMSRHQFTVLVEGADLQSDRAAAALFEAGCDDATIGTAHGAQYLDFDREGSSFSEAVASAVRAIENAVPGSRVLRIADAGLVSMSDIAERLGRTRESVRLLVSGERGPGRFPLPVSDPRSRYRVWRWSEVAGWLSRELGEAVDSDDAEVAASAILEWRERSRVLPEEERRALAALLER